MPGQVHATRRVPQRVAHLPGTARYARNLGDLAVVRHATARYLPDRFPDAAHARFAIHLRQSQPRLDLALGVAQYGIAIQRIEDLLDDLLWPAFSPGLAFCKVFAGGLPH